jgi:hypothetical protein
VVAHGTVEAFRADRGDLAQPEGRILGLEGDDGLPDLGRQPPAILLWVFQVGEEAAHAEGIEAGDPATQGPFRDTGLTSPRRDRLPEQHDRSQHFVGFLIG